MRGAFCELLTAGGFGDVSYIGRYRSSWSNRAATVGQFFRRDNRMRSGLSFDVGLCASHQLTSGHRQNEREQRPEDPSQQIISKDECVRLSPVSSRFQGQTIITLGHQGPSLRQTTSMGSCVLGSFTTCAVYPFEQQTCMFFPFMRPAVFVPPK